MAKEDLKPIRLEDFKDEVLGKQGTPKRDEYEYQLKLSIIGDMIKNTRKKRGLTQTQLGELVGVQKAQISKIENNASNVTIGTILKVFNALKTNVKMKIEFLDTELEIV